MGLEGILSALTGQATVSKAHVIRRIEDLRASGLAPVSINTYLQSVNAFCRWLHEEGHAPSLVRIPRLNEQQNVLATFSQEQVARLIAYPRHRVDREARPGTSLSNPRFRLENQRGALHQQAD